MTAPLINSVQVQAPGDIYVTLREFKTEVDSLRRESSTIIDYERQIADLKLDKEISLRLLTEKFTGEALSLAKSFIEEKASVHNDLLGALKEERNKYITKDDVEKKNETLRKNLILMVSILSLVWGFIVFIGNVAFRIFIK